MILKLNPGEKRKAHSFYYVAVDEEERNGLPPLIVPVSGKRQRKPSRLLVESSPYVSVKPKGTPSPSPFNAPASSTTAASFSSSFPSASTKPDKITARFNPNIKTRATALWPQEELNSLQEYLVDCDSRKEKRDWVQYIEDHDSRKTPLELSMKAYSMSNKSAINARRNVRRQLKRDEKGKSKQEDKVEQQDTEDEDEAEEEEIEEEEAEGQEAEEEMKVKAFKSNPPPTDRPLNANRHLFSSEHKFESSSSGSAISKGSSITSLPPSVESSNLRITIPIVEPKPILPPPPSTPLLPSSKSSPSQLIVKLKSPFTSANGSTAATSSKSEERTWSLSELIALEKAVTEFDSATRFARDWNTIALEFNKSLNNVMASDLGRSASEIKEKWFTSHQDGRMEESVTTRIGSSGSIRNEIVDRKLSNSDVDILSDAIDHEPILRNRTPIIRPPPAPSDYSRSPSLVASTSMNSSIAPEDTIDINVLASSSSKLDFISTRTGETNNPPPIDSSPYVQKKEVVTTTLMAKISNTRRIIDDWDF